MDTGLIFAETIFYFTVSATIIVVGALSAITAFHLIHIARELEELSRKINSTSSEIGERIEDMLDRLSNLPILSYFLRKRRMTRD